MANDEKRDREHESGRSIVAIFQSRAEGHEAIGALHKAHFKTSWLGTTSIAETDRGDEAVTVETGGFFSSAQSLVDALVTRGVSGESARALEGEIEPGNALVTVDPKDRPADEASEILERFGGRVYGSRGASAARPRTTSGSTTTTVYAPSSAGGSVDADAAEVEEETFYRRSGPSRL